MSILVITILYNSSDCILKYLQSINNELSNNIQLLLIENSSPDSVKSKKIIDDWININKSKKRYIKYICHQNLGFGSTCNYAFNYMGKNFGYMLFLNPDTIIEHNAISTLQHHAEHINSDIAGPKIYLEDKSIQKSVFNIPDLKCLLFEFSNLKKIFRTKIGENSFYVKLNTLKTDVMVQGISGTCMLVKTKSFKALSGFDKEYFLYLEDVDLCKRAKNLGMIISYCPHSKIHHLGGSSSKNIYKIMVAEWFKSRSIFINKNYGLITNLLLRPIYFMEVIFLKICRKYN